MLEMSLLHGGGGGVNWGTGSAPRALRLLRVPVSRGNNNAVQRLTVSGCYRRCPAGVSVPQHQGADGRPGSVPARRHRRTARFCPGPLVGAESAAVLILAVIPTLILVLVRNNLSETVDNTIDYRLA